MGLEIFGTGRERVNGVFSRDSFLFTYILLFLGTWIGMR